MNEAKRAEASNHRAQHHSVSQSYVIPVDVATNKLGLLTLVSKNSDVLLQLLKFLNYTDTVMLCYTRKLLRTWIRGVATFAHIEPAAMPIVTDFDMNNWQTWIQGWPQARFSACHSYCFDEGTIAQALRKIAYVYSGELNAAAVLTVARPRSTTMCMMMIRLTSVSRASSNRALCSIVRKSWFERHRYHGILQFNIPASAEYSAS
jgi:hypothetical protein